MSVVELDTSGLRCPLPVLKARRALVRTPPGGLLRVRATDPGAVKDLEGMCAQMGLTFEGWREDGEAFVIDLRKPA
ncbi:MAG: sulfurtransferase TusA family protein [Alphaproteobacteria bacterium]|nr:sulfurtransferase TusA family protein [Alphaproteobacteria bacterium]